MCSPRIDGSNYTPFCLSQSCFGRENELQSWNPTFLGVRSPNQLSIASGLGNLTSPKWQEGRRCYFTALIKIEGGGWPYHISRAVCTKHSLSKVPNLQDCLPDKITPRQIIWGLLPSLMIFIFSRFFRGNALMSGVCPCSLAFLIGLSQSRIFKCNNSVNAFHDIQRVSCKSVLRSTLY